MRKLAEETKVTVLLNPKINLLHTYITFIFIYIHIYIYSLFLFMMRRIEEEDRPGEEAEMEYGGNEEDKKVEEEEEQKLHPKYEVVGAVADDAC